MAVGLVELGIHGALLAEVLGDGDAADGLLDGSVHVGHGAHAAPGDGACQAAETQRSQEDQGHEGQQEQGQLPIDGEQDNGQQDGLGDLREQVGDQDDHLPKLLRIRGDARDDLAGDIFVVEGQVVLGGRLEDIGAQGHDDIADDAHRSAAAQPVGAPAGQVDRHDSAAQQQDLLGGDVLAQGIHALARPAPGTARRPQR